MNEKEKANLLFEKYKFIESVKDRKKCVIIAIEEIKEAIDWHYFETPNKEFEYWDKVKNEIKKI